MRGVSKEGLSIPTLDFKHFTFSKSLSKLLTTDAHIVRVKQRPPPHDSFGGRDSTKFLPSSIVIINHATKTDLEHN